MALDTYAELLADIAATANKTNLTAQIPSFVRLFEAEANRDLDVRQMTRVTNITITYEDYPLPERFGGVRSFRIEGNPAQPLKLVQPEMLDNAFGVGKPERYCITDRITFDPVPDAVYTARLRYRSLLEPLSSANPTNWLLQAHPDAYLYGSLKHLWVYLRFDEEAARAGAMAAEVLRMISEDDKRQAYPSTLNATARPI